MGALEALKAGLHQRNSFPGQFCLLEISIALGAHDTRLGPQRELTKGDLFSGPLLDDRNSQIVTFHIRQAQNKPDSQIRPGGPVTPVHSPTSAKGKSTVSKIMVKAHSAP
jgi:hypothetical protein